MNRHRNGQRAAESMQQSSPMQRRGGEGGGGAKDAMKKDEGGEEDEDENEEGGDEGREKDHMEGAWTWKGITTTAHGCFVAQMTQLERCAVSAPIRLVPHPSSLIIFL